MKFVIKAKGKIFCYESDDEVVTIGRSPDNKFVVPLTDFSRHHCQITKKGDYIFIMDLGSKNGVQIDGQKIPFHEQIPLYPASEVILANFFEFTVSDNSRPSQDGAQDTESLKLMNLMHKIKE